MAYKIFVSYSTKDLATVNFLRKILESGSIEVYVAEYSVGPGTPLAANIIAGIKGCNLFLLLWSRNSKTSDWVPQEIGIAKSDSKTILPVVLEPGLALPGFISDLKYLEAWKNPSVAVAWLRENIFLRAREKEQQEGWAWLAIGGALAALLASK